MSMQVYLMVISELLTAFGITCCFLFVSVSRSVYSFYKELEKCFGLQGAPKNFTPLCFGGKSRLHFVKEKAKVNAAYYVGSLLPMLVDDCKR